MSNNKFKKLYKILISCFLCICIISCSSREEGVNGERNKPSTYIKVHLRGVSEKNSIKNTATIEQKRGNKYPENYHTVFTDNGLSAMMSVHESPRFDLLNSRASLSNNNNLGRAVVNPLVVGTKYRIILQDIKTGEIINQVASSGKDLELKVKPNTEYKWFVYSLNDTLKSPPDIDTEGSLSANDIANTDLSYKSGAITIKSGENYLDVILDHKTAKYLINLDATSLFATVDSTTELKLCTKKNIMQTGNFNVFVGKFTSSEDIPIITGSKLTGTMVKRAVIHTINTDQIPEGELKVNLNLDLVFGSGYKKRYNNITLPFTKAPAIKPEEGKVYTIDVNFKRKCEEVKEKYGPIYYLDPGTYQYPVLFSTVSKKGSLATNGLVMLDGKLGPIAEMLTPGITNVSNAQLSFDLECEDKYVKHKFYGTINPGETGFIYSPQNNGIYYGRYRDEDISDWKICTGTMTDNTTKQKYNVTFTWTSSGSGYGVLDNYLYTQIKIN